MGMFAKATEKSKNVVASTGATKRNTTWTAGDSESDAVGKAVHELAVIGAQMKALDGRKSLHETVVKNFAMRNYVEHIAETGVLPETPTYVGNTDGEKITWITQDRSGQYKVKPEQKEALVQILGAEALEDLLYEEASFKFNRETLAKPGVAEAVEKALEAVVKKLLASGKLSDDDVLVDADVKESFKPGTLDRVGRICGSDTTKIRNFLEALGSAFTRFIKI